MRLKAWVFLNLFRMMRVFLRACQVIEGFKKAPQKKSFEKQKGTTAQFENNPKRPKIVIFTYFQVVCNMVHVVV